jgi:hypothetical protein
MNLLALLLFSCQVFAGDILMIDLNNQGDETKACLDSALRNDPGTDVHIVGAGETVTVQSIEEKIKFVEEVEGRTIDTIVISGHDGSGRYFGSKGELSSEDFAGIIQRRSAAVQAMNDADGGERPPINETLTGMALWGCYTGNANASVNFWMRNISPSIKATVAFALQSPLGKDPANAAILRDYCGGRRKKIADAASEAEMTDVLHAMPNPHNLSLSICYPEGICSDNYAIPDVAAPSCYHSYGELYERCREFDPGQKDLKMYEKYFAATSEAYANPPPDKETYYQTLGSQGHYENGVLRQYYSNLQLWYHCASQLRHETGYIMPPPMSVIRLVKFDMLKQNFQTQEKPIIDQYNAILQKTGLGDYALNLTDKNESRKRIIEKISAVSNHLESIDNEDNTATVKGYNVHRLLQMAYGFNNSLNILEPSCTPFNWVDPGPQGVSQCLAPYGKDPAWPPQ